MKIAVVLFCTAIVSVLAQSKQRLPVSFNDRDILSSDELRKCRDYYRHSALEKKQARAILPLTQCMHADATRVQIEDWKKLFVHAQLVDNDSPSMEVRYAMALMQHHLHHPDQAWRFLLAAKATQEKFPIGASKDQNAIIARIGGGSSFWTGLGSKSKVPIFVVGMSEHTITPPLIDILSKHDRILLAPRNVSIFELHHAEVWKGVAASYRDGEGPSSMKEAVGQSSANLLQEYNKLINQFKPNAKHVLDVSFHNYKSIGFLHMHFPSAVIIHVMRNPLDTILDTYFSGNIDDHAYAADIHTAAAEYGEYIKLMSYWRQVLPMNRLIEINYDDMISSTSAKNKITREVLAKLKLSADDALFKSKPNAYMSVSPGSWLDYKQYLEPVRKVLTKELSPYLTMLSSQSENSVSKIDWQMNAKQYMPASSNKKVVSVLDDDEYEEYEEYENSADYEDDGDRHESSNRDKEDHREEEGYEDEYYDEDEDEYYDENDQNDEDEYYDEEEDEYYDENDQNDEDEYYDEEEDEYYDKNDQNYEGEYYDEEEDEYYDENDEGDEDEYYDEDDDGYYEDDEYDYDYDYAEDEVDDVLLRQSDDNRYIHEPSTATGDFAKLGMQCGTDKATRHGYYRYYPRFTEHLRKSTGGAMLEIGVNQEHSLCLWLQYFPKAFVYGIDVNVTGSGERYKIFKMDQSKRSDLEKLISHKMLSHPIFLVVDDGSHIPEHQLLSFDILFSQVLKPGGTYVIEDVETSYWRKYGVYGYETHYGYHHKKSTIEMFKYIADDINFECLNSKSQESQNSLINGVLSAQTRKMISSVTFGQNTIIVTKKTVAEQKKYGYREYPYAVAL